MLTLDHDGHHVLGWPVVAGTDPVPAEGPVLLELARFREAEGRNAPTGVVIDAATPHAVLDEVAARAAAIAVRFPLFRDGRGFTLVRRLRERVGYAGPIIAMGHVLPDQWPHLRRLGASIVQLPDDADLQAWRTAARRYGFWYQAAPLDPGRLSPGATLT